MVFQFEHNGIRYKTDETSALGVGSIIILSNNEAVVVTGWNKMNPPEPIVRPAPDAQMSDMPEATARLNRGSVLAHLA